MRTTTLACAALALLAAPAARAADRYEMEDLEVLDRQGAWEELAEHLTDVRPSKRDAKWLSIAEHTLLGQLAATELNERSAPQILASLKSAMSRYPALKQSKSFMAARADLGLKAFGYTARGFRGSETHEWVSQLRDFILADTLTPDLAQKAARKVQEQYVSSQAWPLWKLALERGASLCKDPDFDKMVLEALVEGSWLEEIQPVVENKCWNELKGAVAAEAEKAKYDPQLDRLCPLLKAKKVKAAKCEGR